MTTPETEPDTPIPSRLAKWLRWRYVIPLLIVLSPLFFLAGYRAYYLSQVPVIPPPFDVDAFGTVEVAEEDNAYPLYKRVVSDWNTTREPTYGDIHEVVRGSWEVAVRNQRAWEWLNDNQHVMEILREAAEKPLYLERQPKEITFFVDESLADKFKKFCWLMILQGKLLELDGGDVEAAWEWYRTAFRASRQVGQHGLSSERSMGVSCHEITAEAIIAWADHPQVTAEQIQQAADDLRRIYLRSVPPSVGYKMLYLRVDSLLWDPPSKQDCEYEFMGYVPTPRWRYDLLTIAKIEPQFSRRLNRHLCRNWLPQVDLPKHLRASSISTSCSVFDASNSPHSTQGEMSSQEIDRSLERSYFAYTVLRGRMHLCNLVDEENARQNILIVVLAAQQYRREHGDFPPDAKALLDGGYLPEMPLDSLQSTKAFIQYRNTEDCVTVYSLGLDGIDQGGCEADWNLQEGDLGVVLRRRREAGDSTKSAEPTE